MGQVIYWSIVIVLGIVPVPEHSPVVTDGEPSVNKAYVLDRINKLRTRGCRCGGRYYEPVEPLEWNDLLYKSAVMHARDMYEEDYFSHISPDGKDVGDRLDDVGYYWQFAGENLAEGQRSFDQAMRDWIASKTHCIMLMHPKMKEVGVGRYGDYWVQHFGRKMPATSKRVNRRYSEGD